MKIKSLPGSRALHVGLALLAILLLARACAPVFIEVWLEDKLAARPDFEGQLDDVDLSLWGPSLELEGVHIVDTPESPLDVELNVPRVTLATTWHDLLSGDTRVDVHLLRPEVTLRAIGDGDPSGEPATLEGIRSITIEDGTASVRLHPADDVDVVFALEAIDGALEESADRPTRTLTARFWADARVVSGGVVRVEGAVAPLAPAELWTVEFQVSDLEIPPFNPALRTVLGVDAQSGRLSLKGAVSATFGLEGWIEPSFSDLALYSAYERTRRPMTEAIFSEMLAGTDGTIPIHRPPASERGSERDPVRPPEDPLQLRHVDGLMHDMILSGYDRRLDDLDGYFATIGGLRMDLEAGELVFEDITILKDHMFVPLPFFYTERMIVRIDRSLITGDGDELPPLKDVTLVRPTLTFVMGPDKTTSQVEFDPQWPDKVSSLPYPTEALHVVDGRVELWYLEQGGGLVYLSDLDVEMRRMYSGRLAEGERRTTFDVSALAMNDAALTIHGAYRPGATPPDLEADIELAPLQVASLNSVLRALLGVDVSSGTARVHASIDTHEGKTVAHLDPQFHDLVFMGPEETHFDHPVLELIAETGLARRVAGPVTLRYDSDRPFARLPAEVAGALLRP